MPTFDPEELKTALAAYLANTLPDLVRQTIAGAVDQAVTRATSSDETEDQETKEQGTEGQEAKASAQESTEATEDQLNSMLFLDALASSQNQNTPNGMYPHGADEQHDEDPNQGPIENYTENYTESYTDDPDANGLARKRRGPDENDPSNRGPRTQA
jgi:hypothetical protein